MLSLIHLVIACLISQVASQFYDTGPSCHADIARCPNDPALSSILANNFSGGQITTDFKVWLLPSPEYKSDGMHLPLSMAGDTPTISSNKYIMFGNIKVVMKKVSAVGIISGIALQSECMDEIDFTFFSYMSTVETNWYGRHSGQDPVISNRVLGVNDGNTSDGFNTYEVDWTYTKIQWIINGVLVRTLLREQVPSTSQYPQTPMALRIGAYDAGDDAYGTQWAGGPVDWLSGPYSMIVKSVEMRDYSTGSSYSYYDMNCNLNSVRSDNTTKGININASPISVSAPSAVSTTATPAAPSTTSTTTTAAASSSSSSNLPIAMEVTIIICVSVLGLAMMTLALVILRRRKARGKTPPAQEKSGKHLSFPESIDQIESGTATIELEHHAAELGPPGVQELPPRTPKSAV